MSTIQVPKSIKKISLEVQDYVISRYPNCIMLDDVDVETLIKWETKCNHELFYQDASRFIDDIYTITTDKMGTKW